MPLVLRNPRQFLLCLALTVGSATGALAAPTPINTYYGNWATGFNYAIGNVVTYKNQTWLSLVSRNRSQTPGLSAAWQLLGSNVPGPTGPQGPIGLTGPAGPQGLPGIAGPQGIAGAIGAPGPQGTPGVAGKDGVDGKDGAPGIAGAKGDAGPKGDPGSAGKDGLNGASVLSGSGVPDDAFGAVGDFFIDSASSHFYGPKTADGWPDTFVAMVGPKGDQGLPGAAGGQGLPGVDGKDGAPGLAGMDGKDGAPGLKGDKGDTGAQGLAGADGKDGKDGAAGRSYFEAQAGDPCTPGGSDYIGIGTLVIEGVNGRDTLKCDAPRFLDTGSTVYDRYTSLEWEKKTTAGGIHDVTNTYTWSYDWDHDLDGTVITSFIDILNTSPCYRGKCDWRLPSVTELQSILAAQYPTCKTSPCIDGVFGPTSPTSYISSTESYAELTGKSVKLSPIDAFSNSSYAVLRLSMYVGLSFNNGGQSTIDKKGFGGAYPARAVRGPAR